MLAAMGAEVAIQLATAPSIDEGLAADEAGDDVARSSRAVAVSENRSRKVCSFHSFPLELQRIQLRNPNIK
jgi:hypothetical protein